MSRLLTRLMVADGMGKLGEIIHAVAPMDPNETTHMVSVGVFALIYKIEPEFLDKMQAAIQPCGASDCYCHLSAKSAIEALKALVPVVKRLEAEAKGGQ